MAFERGRGYTATQISRRDRSTPPALPEGRREGIPFVREKEGKKDSSYKKEGPRESW